MIGHPNLKLWLPLQDSVADASGTVTPSAIGTPSYAAGVIGSAIVLNGSSQTIDCGLPLGANTCPAAYAIAMWVKPAAFGSYLTTNINGTTTSGMGIILEGTGKIQIFWLNNATVVSTTSTLTVGTWTHVCCVFQTGATGGKVYLDGVLAVSGDLSTQITSQSSKVKIGSRWVTQDSGGAAYFNGTIDDVQFYNIALPISGIKRIRLGLHPLNRS